MVPTLSLAYIICNMILGLVIPIGLFRYFRKKYNASRQSFIVGCLVMLVFALTLEQIVHGIVLRSSVGALIQGNIWLYALYGGIMAGLFEETGRLLGMKVLLKKDMGNVHNSLMYGAGHGGIEVFMILIMGNLNNLLYSVMINQGKMEALLEPLDETIRPQLQAAFDQLIATPSWHFLLSPAERIGAVAAQISLSVLVWFAVRGGKRCMHLYILAIFLHFLLDASSAVLSRSGVSVILVEVFIWIMAAVFACIASIVWKKYRPMLYGDEYYM